MKKLLAGGTLAVLAFGGMIAGAAPASAHTPHASADCGTVNVDLKLYKGADLTVVIDGVAVEDTTFDREFSKSYEISRDAAHEWSVDVVAHDTTQYKDYDFNKSGTTVPCETPTPPVEPEPTPEPTAPPVTEEPTEEPTVEPTVEPTEPPAEPTEEASVAPVDDEPSASPSPVAEEEPEVLAATGATVGGAIGFAALLAAGGVALVWARKRMQNA